MVAALGIGACQRDSATRDVAATATATPPAATALPAPAQRPRVVALGDSLTAGLGLPTTDIAWPALVQQKIAAAGLDAEIVNAGVSGDTTAGGLRRLDWALEGNVKVLIVAFGGNDGLRGLPVPQMKENLSQIIDRARERSIVVIHAGMEAPPNFGQEYATGFRQAFRDVALNKRVLFIPFLLNNVAGKPELNQADGIHPNQQGTQIVADTVWSVLEPLLDQMSGAS